MFFTHFTAEEVVCSIYIHMNRKKKTSSLVPSIRVTSELNLSKDEREKLASILDCEVSEISSKLGCYASAALMEYVSMMLGQKVFRRGSDMLEYRLFLLITTAFENTIPDEQDVCRIFQATSNESRSLIRSVMSKFQYQLKEAITASMKEVIESAESPGDGESYSVTIHSISIVDSLNVILARNDGGLQPVSKKRGSVSDYVISPSSYQTLCKELNIQINDG